MKRSLTVSFLWVMKKNEKKASFKSNTKVLYKFKRKENICRGIKLLGQLMSLNQNLKEYFKERYAVKTIFS